MRLTDKEITDALRNCQTICRASWADKKYYIHKIISGSTFYDSDGDVRPITIIDLEADDWEIFVWKN